MTTRTPGEVLREARQRDSVAKRTRVLAIVEQMLRTKQPVSFAAVAKAAGVSNWLVYAPGVREHIEAARAQQVGQPRRDRAAGLSPSTARLRTDLELARAEIKALRAERDQLKTAVRQGLGQQLDQIASQELVERINELTEQNRRLTTELQTTRTENRVLTDRATEAEEERDAARTSLLSALRGQSRAAPPPTPLRPPRGPHEDSPAAPDPTGSVLPFPRRNAPPDQDRP
jgi:hypothetical protein